MTVSDETFYAEITRRLAVSLEDISALKLRLEDVTREVSLQHVSITAQRGSHKLAC